MQRLAAKLHVADVLQGLRQLPVGQGPLLVRLTADPALLTQPLQDLALALGRLESAAKGTLVWLLPPQTPAANCVFR